MPGVEKMREFASFRRGVIAGAVFYSVACGVALEIGAIFLGAIDRMDDGRAVAYIGLCLLFAGAALWLVLPARRLSRRLLGTDHEHVVESSGSGGGTDGGLVLRYPYRRIGLGSMTGALTGLALVALHASGAIGTALLLTVAGAIVLVVGLLAVFGRHLWAARELLVTQEAWRRRTSVSSAGKM